MRTTGPVLAVGAITIANSVILNGRAMDWRIPIATGVAASAFALAERAWADGAVALAWVALVTVLFARVQPGTPAPVESALNWWSGTRGVGRGVGSGASDMASALVNRI